MPTRTNTSPTPADLVGLDPTDYRDGCTDCIATAQAAEDYIVLPYRIRPADTGLLASYSHTCGNTWTCSWAIHL